MYKKQNYFHHKPWFFEKFSGPQALPPIRKVDDGEKKEKKEKKQAQLGVPHSEIQVELIVTKSNNPYF